MAFDKTAVKGLAEARKVFKTLPDETQESMRDAADATAQRVAYEARMRLRPGHGYRTGELQKAIDVSKATKGGFARVGLVRRAVVVTLPTGHQVRYRPSAIGHLVEFGHGAVAPRPFMIPAAESQRGPYAQRAASALKGMERTLASQGGRLL